MSPMREAILSICTSRTMLLALVTGIIAPILRGLGVPETIISDEVCEGLVALALLIATARATTTKPLHQRRAKSAPPPPRPFGPRLPPSGPSGAVLLLLILASVSAPVAIGAGCGLLTSSTIPTVVSGAGTVLRVASGACRIVEGLEGVRSQLDRAAFDQACGATPGPVAVVACRDIDEGDEVRLIWVGAAGGACEACVLPGD